MKKYKLGLLLFLMLIMPGCGLAEQVGNGVSFATDTAAYMQNMREFGQEMDTWATNAVTDPAARQELLDRLTSLKEESAQYANLQVPEYAAELHQTIKGYNETLQQGLDQAITNVEEGKAAFESTGIPDTINKVNELISQINQLIP
ncbi:hypothetical protein C2I18_26975 [Paenibacillus sp. PK3_47]|uniref:DUF6376 family protein n=1 Tax=Paenibacillus sp. PK3_47 TaxID=2072642 RepID=UPI00201E304E|nr:DUF6376 family protein [Paenibacillus sp. PK3_47]UQZ36853.1 hypothetical protein C2I18_26975 [Paenibacillus sp. PK3_47]